MKLVSRMVGLEALSLAQRRYVEESLGLVRLTLARFARFDRRDRGQAELRADLRQEACMALVEAVRNHHPARHGAFAPYAMSRIRFAIAKYRQEQGITIRVPFATYRRRLSASWRRGAKDDGDSRGPRRRPDELPRPVPWSFERTCARDTRSSRRRRHTSSRNDGISGCIDVGTTGLGESRNRSSAPARTVGALIRGRYLRAARRAVGEMKRRSARSADRAKLLDRCLRERWTIPDEDSRTPIRALARELGCSLGAVTHGEEKFRRLMSDSLSSDPAFNALRQMARASDDGYGHILTAEEWAHVRRVQ